MKNRALHDYLTLRASNQQLRAARAYETAREMYGDSEIDPQDVAWWQETARRFWVRAMELMVQAEAHS